MNLTATDFFCGAGGSSTGLVAAGVEVRHAANHWALAIETHNTNHPQTEHYLDDLQQAHPSWYPRTDIAWFSPECTNHSLAKGRKRKGTSQLSFWDKPQVDPEEERSRATMREVVEFTEFHRYEIVIVENVVDIRHWQFYEDWYQAVENLGYHGKTLYLNAQFFGVPQSRDRWYTVFWKRGNPAPDLRFKPTAYCHSCGEEIAAVQSWKKPEFPWGRYGSNGQYVYRCPQCAGEVIPATTPAHTVIDWAILAQPIGERDKPLKPKTIERIKAGLRKFAHQSVLVDLGYSHAQHQHKVTTTGQPLPTQTTRQTLALAVPPFVMAYYGGNAVYRKVDQPMPGITTIQRHALIEPDEIIDECRFRMLEPDERKQGMSFPEEYIILGSKRNQVRQIGNAVCCYVATEIVLRCVQSLS